MRGYWPLLVLLASIWGASYLFIKVAVDDIPPAAMTDIRLLVAGVLLLFYRRPRLRRAPPRAAGAGGDSLNNARLQRAFVGETMFPLRGPLLLKTWGTSPVHAPTGAGA